LKLICGVDVSTFAETLLEHPEPYRPFLPLLSHSSNPEEPIPLLTSAVLSSLIGAAQTKHPKLSPQTTKAVQEICKYLSKLSQSQDSGLQDIAVLEYSSVLRSTGSRQLFWKSRKETLGPLMEVLRTAAGASKDTDSTLWSGGTSIRSATDSVVASGVGLQLLYHVLLVVWQLSYESAAIGQELEEYVHIDSIFLDGLLIWPQ